MSWFDLLLAAATVWRVGCFAPVCVDWYRADMSGGNMRPIYARIAVCVALLAIPVGLQVAL